MAPIYPVYMKDENGNNLLDANGKKQFDYGETRPQDNNSNAIAGFYDDPTTNTTESLSARTYLTFGSDDERAGALQGLKGTVNFGVDYSISNNMQYFNREHGNQASNGGLIYKYNYRYMTYTFNQLITYDRTFADPARGERAAGSRVLQLRAELSRGQPFGTGGRDLRGGRFHD